MRGRSIFGAAVVETLPLQLAHTFECFEHFGAFHAFCRYRQCQPAPERDNRFHQPGVGVCAREFRYEAAVDFQPVERQRAQLRQIGIAGPEIIKAEADALIFQAGYNRPNRADILVQAAFGNLDFQPLRRETALHQQLQNLLRKPRITQLDR